MLLAAFVNTLLKFEQWGGGGGVAGPLELSFYCLSSQTRNTMANKTAPALLSGRRVSARSERLFQGWALCVEMRRKARPHCFTG